MCLWFLTFSIVFRKIELFISLKNFFSNSFWDFFLNSVFTPIYGFNHAFCLDWITLYTSFSVIPWFNACFKAPMWITYFPLSSILQISFSTFSTFFLSGRNGKSLWKLNKFFGYWTSTSRKYPRSLIFYEAFIKFW